MGPSRLIPFDQLQGINTPAKRLFLRMVALHCGLGGWAAAEVTRGARKHKLLTNGQNVLIFAQIVFNAKLSRICE